MVIAVFGEQILWLSKRMEDGLGVSVWHHETGWRDSTLGGFMQAHLDVIGRGPLILGDCIVRRVLARGF